MSAPVTGHLFSETKKYVYKCGLVRKHQSKKRWQENSPKKKEIVHPKFAHTSPSDETKNERRKRKKKLPVLFWYTKSLHHPLSLGKNVPLRRVFSVREINPGCPAIKYSIERKKKQDKMQGVRGQLTGGGSACSLLLPNWVSKMENPTCPSCLLLRASSDRASRTTVSATNDLPCCVVVCGSVDAYTRLALGFRGRPWALRA